MSIKVTIELDHTSESQLKIIQGVIKSRMEQIETIDTDPTANGQWAACFNMLCDLDTDGFEL